MSAWEAFILCIVQGVTEFLPVSSSGHMILVGRLLGIRHMPLSFELVTHLATLLAVLIALRKPVWKLVKKPFSKKTALLLTATVPTVLIFFLFQSFFRSAFDGRFLIYSFGVTAVLIFVTGFFPLKKRAEPQSLKPLPSFLDAAFIGIAQGIAGLPGISRSGATICTARIAGVEKEAAAEFSFLLSVPIIIGSSLFEFIGDGSAGMVSAGALFIGFLTAFAVGFICINFMLKFVAKRGMNGFAVYLMILTVFLFVDKFLLGLF